MGISHYLIKNGKILREWTTYDEFALLKQTLLASLNRLEALPQYSIGEWGAALEKRTISSVELVRLFSTKIRALDWDGCTGYFSHPRTWLNNSSRLN